MHKNAAAHKYVGAPHVSYVTLKKTPESGCRLGNVSSLC
jgi:hypothetical protein